MNSKQRGGRHCSHADASGVRHCRIFEIPPFFLSFLFFPLERRLKILPSLFRDAADRKPTPPSFCNGICFSVPLGHSSIYWNCQTRAEKRISALYHARTHTQHIPLLRQKNSETREGENSRFQFAIPLAFANALPLSICW